MKLNKYTVAISMALLLTVIEAYSCGWVDDSGYYSSPFRLDKLVIYDEYTGDRAGYGETLDFWSDYVNGNVSREEIRKFFDKATIDSIRANRHYRFYDYLVRNNDKNAINYINDCLRLGELVDEYQGNLWSYDVPDEGNIRRFISQLEKVSTSDVFKPRYEFLKIRSFGAIKDNEGVRKVWQRNSKKPMSEALRDRMQGYVGGVLYREGRYEEALDYFYNSGDQNSIEWCVEKLAGSDNLKRLYDYNPNSQAIPFILQDFMNYLIASTQAGRYISKEDIGGSVYDDYMLEAWGKRIYDVSAQQADMINLCRRALEEGKTENPMMWATCLGVLQTIGGNYAEGLNSLRQAMNMPGNKNMAANLDNFMLWALMVNSGRGNDYVDKEFTTTLKTYYDKIKAEGKRLKKDYKTPKNKRDENLSKFYAGNYNFLTNFFAVEGINHFKSLNQPERAMALMAMLSELPVPEYGKTFTNDLRDCIHKEKTLALGYAFYKYIKDDNHSEELDKALHPYAKRQWNLVNDAIGTRLMREGKFEDALNYLSEVDGRWLNTQRIAPYIGECYAGWYNFAYGGKRESSEILQNSVNHKAEFCSNFIEKMNDYDKAIGNEKAKIALELAAYCHYASPEGAGWGMAQYEWSYYNPVNEYTAMMKKWLDRAWQFAQNTDTKASIAYARLALPVTSGDETSWFGVDYPDYNSKVFHYYINATPQEHSQALGYLRSVWNRQDLPYYVSHCDVLKAYVAGRFVARPEYY